MTQQGMLLGAEVVGSEVERLARQHARRWGLRLLRVERAPGLFAEIEVAVFARADGGEVRRTAEMMAAARGTDAA